MADREKIKTWLKGLFKANPTICPMGDCDSCPYFENKDDCYKELRTDALELLKEQEAVEPKHNPLSPTDWFCGKCGMCISRFHDYCPSCGQAVKWDG